MTDNQRLSRRELDRIQREIVRGEEQAYDQAAAEMARRKS